MKKLILALVLLAAGNCFGNWISPASFSDPNSRWSNEARAYDVNMSLYASTSGLVSQQTPGHYLELFPASEVADCCQVKVFMDVGLDADSIIDVNYGGEWINIHEGALVDGWNILLIGSSETVVGMRIRRSGTITGTTFRVHEAMFYTPSVTDPCQVVGVSPADDATGQSLKVTLQWALGDLMNTDNYKLYLGTDSPPTSLVNGEVVNITTSTTLETYNPNGLPPSTEYFWRVDANSEKDVNAGVEYSFTTRAVYKQFLPKGIL